MNESITKKMEDEEIQSQSNVAIKERIQISDTEEESTKEMIQTVNKLIPKKKSLTPDVHRQLRIAFHTRRDSTI